MSRFPNSFLQVYSGSELRNASTLYFDNGTRLWISSVPGFALVYAKRAKSGKRDVIATFKSSSDTTHHCVDSSLRLRFVEVSIFADFFNEISLVHVHLSLRRISTGPARRLVRQFRDKQLQQLVFHNGEPTFEL